jgi:hypothetical protein
MGNRANVVFVAGQGKNQTISPAVYLHWNGGPESVYAFLDELDVRGVRADGEYEAARFVQIVGEFFDEDYHSTLSLGILGGPKAITATALDKLPTDSGDNGFYIVRRDDRDPAKRIVRRFLNRAVGDGLVERSHVYVAREHTAAIADPKYLTIRAWFDAHRKLTEEQYHAKRLEEFEAKCAGALNIGT